MKSVTIVSRLMDRLGARNHRGNGVDHRAKCIRWSSVVFCLSFLPACLQVNAGSLAGDRLKLTFQMGQDATLTCTVDNIGKQRQVIWRRLSDPFPISVGTTKYLASSKYKIKRVGDDWKLTIKSVGLADAGEYECRLSGSDDTANIISLIIPGADNTHILPTETIHRAKIGDTVVLPCHVKNKRRTLVLWQKEGREVLSLRQKVYSGDRRHRVLHGRQEEWNLQISSVSAEDYGLYTCVVNTAPPLTRTVYLQREDDLGTGEVSNPGSPALVSETFQEEVGVPVGHSITLRCQFTGKPAPTVTWSRRIWVNGEKISEDLNAQGETYQLYNAKEEDQGLYVCQGRNGVPPLAYGKIKLRITTSPQEMSTMTTSTTLPTTTTPFDPVENVAPRAFPVQAIVYQKKGRAAELDCRAVGLPRPSITWSKGGLTITTDNKHMVTSTEHSHHTRIGKLAFHFVSTSNFGEYHCEAHNMFGEARAVVELRESF